MSKHEIPDGPPLPLEYQVMEESVPDVEAKDGWVKIYAAENYGEDALYLTPEQAEAHSRAVIEAAREARRHTD